MILYLQDAEKDRIANLEKVTFDEILELQRDELQEKQREIERKKRDMLKRGVVFQVNAIEEEFL